MAESRCGRWYRTGPRRAHVLLVLCGGAVQHIGWWSL
eukprot:COSAG06_NODE_18242_length_896_cov_2.392723_2_plen_36_part_01